MTRKPTGSSRAAATALSVDRSVVTAGAVSLVAFGFAAARADKWLAIFAAGFFAVRMIWSAIKTVPAHPPLAVLQSTTWLTAVTMAWASLALLTAYPLVGLKWQHGWQYGLGAAVLAALFFNYARQLDTSGSRQASPQSVEMARRLSAVLAFAIFCAVIWLVASGKLATLKGDWLANDVFLAAAASVFALSLIAVIRARAN